MSIRVCLVIVVVVAVAAAAMVGTAARGANRGTSAVHWALLPGTLRSASTPRIAGTQRRTVYASDFAATSVDNAPSGTSQGDELAVAGQLRNAGGKKIGKLEVHEVLTSVAPQDHSTHCHVTLARRPAQRHWHPALDEPDTSDGRRRHQQVHQRSGRPTHGNAGPAQRREADAPAVPAITRAVVPSPGRAAHRAIAPGITRHTRRAPGATATSSGSRRLTIAASGVGEWAMGKAAPEFACYPD